MTEIEIRSVNNRFLETQLRLPRSLFALEVPLRNLIREKLHRGSVQCTVTVGSGEKMAAPDSYQPAIVRGLLQVCRKMQEDYPDIQGALTLDRILEIPDVIVWSDLLHEEEGLEFHLQSLMQEALQELQIMRAEEGANLRQDLLCRIKHLDELLDQVTAQLPGRIESVRDRMKERITQLLRDQEVDEVRLIQEVSLLADRLDISEEITRFRSHNQLFRQSLEDSGPHGKKLNFILQEMGREANTMGTKSQHPDIAHLAVACKEEVEMIREQVQNLE